MLPDDEIRSADERRARRKRQPPSGNRVCIYASLQKYIPGAGNGNSGLFLPEIRIRLKTIKMASLGREIAIEIKVGFDACASFGSIEDNAPAVCADKLTARAPDPGSNVVQRIPGMTRRHHPGRLDAAVTETAKSESQLLGRKESRSSIHTHLVQQIALIVDQACIGQPGNGILFPFTDHGATLPAGRQKGSRSAQ